jgi:hypothetical protein
MRTIKLHSLRHLLVGGAMPQKLALNRVIVAFHKSDKANGGSFEIDCLVFEKGHLWVLGGIFWVSYP